MFCAQLADKIYDFNDAKVGDKFYFGFINKCVEATVKHIIFVDGVLGWVLGVPEMAAVVLVIRGSENKDNFATDFNAFSKSGCYVNGVGCGNVHAGFYKNYNLWRDDTRKAIVDYANENSVSRLYVTGHSLGAALASLAAFDLATFFDQAGGLPIANIHLSLFGSPRVGDAAFVEALRTFMRGDKDKKVTISAIRYYNKIVSGWERGDPVTSSPPENMGYYHIIDPVALQATPCANAGFTAVALCLHRSFNYVGALESSIGHRRAVCDSNDMPGLKGFNGPPPLPKPTDSAPVSTDDTPAPTTAVAAEDP